MAMHKRLWIFANGDLAAPENLLKLIRPGDCIYAADGGARRLAQLGLRPAWVIGDLDSLSDMEIAALEAGGSLIARYPVEKEETDLELALLKGIQDGFGIIRIATALGGRLDQTLGNLFLLQLPEAVGCDLRLEDGLEEVFLIREAGEVRGAVGDVVSLLPLGGPAHGVSTNGLQYPLHSESLYPERTRGISNVMLAAQARIVIQSGCLICIHRHEKDEHYPPTSLV